MKLTTKAAGLPIWSPLDCNALTDNFLASPILGETLTLNGESGICSSLNLIETKYSPGSATLYVTPHDPSFLSSKSSSAFDGPSTAIDRPPAPASRV